jgi:hypothetical protein
MIGFLLGAVPVILIRQASSSPPERWQPVSLSPVYNPATGMTYTIPLSGVACGSGAFVAVGWNGTILTAPSRGAQRGQVWTSRRSGTSMFLSDVTYGRGTFLAVGLNGVALASPDGVTWTNRTPSFHEGPGYSLLGVSYGNNTFVAVGTGGIVLTSPDGVTWTVRIKGSAMNPSGVVDDDLGSVTYGNGIFVAVGINGAIVTSLDGAAWAVRHNGKQAVGLRSVAYGNHTFVAVGVDKGVHNNGYYGGVVLTSPDGMTWTKCLHTDSQLSAVTCSRGTFVAVGDKGTILTSPDGLHWTSGNSGTNETLNSVAYGNGTFMAVGTNSTIVRSLPGSLL